MSRSRNECPTGRLALPWALAGVLAAAGCSKSPASPDPAAHTYLGDWQGTVVSEAIGTGTIRLTVAREIAGGSAVQISGTFSMTFVAPGFDVSGTFSGSEGRTQDVLGIFFDRSTVPCPGEPGGRADRAIAATLNVDAGRIIGTYIAAGCPGGTIDATKK